MFTMKQASLKFFKFSQNRNSGLLYEKYEEYFFILQKQKIWPALSKKSLNFTYIRSKKESLVHSTKNLNCSL